MGGVVKPICTWLYQPKFNFKGGPRPPEVWAYDEPGYLVNQALACLLL